MAKRAVRKKAGRAARGGVARSGTRVKKRWAAPALVLAVMAAAFIWAFRVGTVPDPDVKMPTGVADGIVAQVVAGADGTPCVRGAVVIGAGVDSVWAVVTDYAHFGEIFPYLSSVTVKPAADGRRTLTGQVAPPFLFMKWPFSATIAHKRMPEGYLASWDEPSGNVVRNRGSWHLSRRPDHTTLVEYTLDVGVRPYPDWLVRTALLTQVRAVLGAAAKTVEARRRP